MSYGTTSPPVTDTSAGAENDTPGRAARGRDNAVLVDPTAAANSCISLEAQQTFKLVLTSPYKSLRVSKSLLETAKTGHTLGRL